MNTLQIADYIVFFIYFILVSAYGIYIYKKKKAATTSSNDFFLAEGSLTWWAIGASLIASNISAEHFIGMSGSGFALGHRATKRRSVSLVLHWVLQFLRMNGWQQLRSLL